MLLTINRKWAMALGILFSLPTAYFISISMLSDIGYPYLSNALQPLLERLGSRESLGFNINLLILFGPLIALALNLFAVLKIEWDNEGDTLSVTFSIQKYWWNMALIILPGMLLAVLFVYAIGENCGCY